jgi:hypothetical protein
VQQTDPQRRRIDRAVVERRKRDAAADSELRTAELVHDLAGLLRGLRRLSRALQARKDPQRAGGELGSEWQQEACRPDRVPPEQGEEPRRSGGEELLAGTVHCFEPQCVEVLERSPNPSFEPFVARGHL